MVEWEDDLELVRLLTPPGSEREVSWKPSHFCPLRTQGSSKLEKAEVLQMTVDHLKMLHATGGTGTDAFLSHESFKQQICGGEALGIHW